MPQRKHIFSLFDFCKSADKLQVFDAQTLDNEGNVIPFVDQAAIVTHYMHMINNGEVEIPYRALAEKIPV